MRDIISDLPDPVLLHILSSDSLDTKQVIATSLLSRRWRSLWLSIPKLHFLIDHRVHSHESFVQFIDAALLLVDLNSVKKFYLECDGNFCIPSIKVNIWITALMRNKLEHLTLYLCYYGDFFKLPASVFMWSTIRVIKLSGVILSNLSSVNLPSLRALHLAHVKVTESQSLTILLSNLVYLEELRINFLDMDSNDPNLKLDIRRYDYLVCANAIFFSPPSLLPIEMFSNVTFLQFGEGDWFLRDDIPTFNNLIHLTMCYLNYEVWSDFVTSLRNCLKLETLITHGSCWGRDGDGNDSEDDVVLMGTIPEVSPCVLSHLKVFVFHTLDRNCEMVQFILEHAKVLREIVIRIPYFKSDVYKFLREFIPPICPDNCRLSIDVGMADEFSVSKKFRY